MSNTWKSSVVILLMAAATSADAQQRANRAGRRPLLARDVEIALARSAAPSSISARSRVMVLTDTGYVVADSGSSAVTCVVNRSWAESVEPHCYDAEGVESVMPIELRRNFLRHRGVSETEIDAEIGRGIASGKFRLPRRPAMTYMMSAEQRLYGDDGNFVGNWKPHIMIYYPYLTPSAFGLPQTPEMKVGMVSEAGRYDSSFIVVVQSFVELPTARKP
jgi:hypothetical protein